MKHDDEVLTSVLYAVRDGAITPGQARTIYAKRSRWHQFKRWVTTERFSVVDVVVIYTASRVVSAVMDAAL